MTARTSSLSTMMMKERVMAKLIYASNMSLDGCTEDEHGAFDWAPPDDHVFAFITKLMPSAGRLLLNPARAAHHEHPARTPLRAQRGTRPEGCRQGGSLVGGPNLAAQALVAGLVDELALFVWPVVLGGRNPALPTGTRVDLELIDEHRFSSGVVHLRYRLQ
jgi:hypothetical protein